MYIGRPADHISWRTLRRSYQWPFITYEKNYILQVETIQHYFFDWTIVETTYGVAFLEYENTSLPVDKSKLNFLPTDCSPEKKCTVLNCPFERYPSDYNYKCLSYDKLKHPHPENIDKEILQDTQFTEGYEEHFINMHYDSHVDGFKFEFPTGMPYYNEDKMNLISKDCTSVNCPRNADKYDRNCNCFYHKKHKLGNIIQIVLYNMGTGGAFSTGYAHPFHIHGTHYYVMKVGWPSYNASGMIENLNPDIACAGPHADCDGASWANKTWLNGAVSGMNTKNPSSRDTITLPVGGYIVIRYKFFLKFRYHIWFTYLYTNFCRFRAKNPGWFFAHCHLVLHHMGGTAYAFKVGEDSEIPMPPDNFPHDCGYFSMPSVSHVYNRN
uniref:Plastocyanin-like domain-containing protein n=1 Tax=Heterorhabditis bacteriophora TaxID=37862 RepID=A0A1I7XRL1_HETBA